ncbi:MAG: hypothetical protein P3W94_008210 [Paracoccus sp. (in: a-proteobacteria)]|nr:hypothetical protein [Paracoccus sp. (in: a-proteobacteria)]
MSVRQPGRGNPQLGKALLHALRRAAARREDVALVDFSRRRGWRSHQYFAWGGDGILCRRDDMTVVRAAA